MGFFDIFGKNTEKDMIYMALLALVSELDGDVSDKERLYASQFGNTLTKSRREKGEKALRETKLSYEEILQKASQLELDERTDLLQELVNMANADGKIDSKEAKFLVGVTGLLNLNHEAMIKILIDNYGLTEKDFDLSDSDKNSNNSVKKSNNTSEDNSIGFKKNRNSSVDNHVEQKTETKVQEITSKEEAKKELVSLKEYLDLGIITQQDFDKKAVAFKKILLGN